MRNDKMYDIEKGWYDVESIKITERIYRIGTGRNRRTS